MTSTIRRSPRLNPPFNRMEFATKEDPDDSDYAPSPSLTSSAPSLTSDDLDERDLMELVLNSPATPTRPRPLTPIRDYQTGHNHPLPDDYHSPADTQVGTPQTPIRLLGSPFQQKPVPLPSIPDTPPNWDASPIPTNRELADNPRKTVHSRGLQDVRDRGQKRIKTNKENVIQPTAYTETTSHELFMRLERRSPDLSLQRSDSLPSHQHNLGRNVTELSDLALVEGPATLNLYSEGDQDCTQVRPSTTSLMVMASSPLHSRCTDDHFHLTYNPAVFNAAKSAKHYHILTHSESSTEGDSRIATRSLTERSSLSPPPHSTSSLTCKAGSWLADQQPMHAGTPLVQDRESRASRNKTPPRSASPLKRCGAVADLSPSIKSPKRPLASGVGVEMGSPGKRPRRG